MATRKPLVLVSGRLKQLASGDRLDLRETTASTATLTPSALVTHTAVTALAANLTIAAPAGTPQDGDKIIFAIKDNGTSRTLTWNAIYRQMSVALPAATVVNKMLYVGAIYRDAATKWDIVAIEKEA